ncbi:MAG: hypothetical protein AB8G15_02320 [Saprospiraceae bacterium]
MKNLTILIFICFYSIQIQAQRAQAIYAELGGAGLRYSINYDTRFTKQENGIGARIGFGTMINNNVLIPVHINYLHGIGNHKFELGLGITTFFYQKIENNKRTRQPFPLASGALMYRYQAKDGHFLFRAGISPTFLPFFSGFDGKIDIFDLLYVWPGVSVGYKF